MKQLRVGCLQPDTKNLQVDKIENYDWHLDFILLQKIRLKSV